MGEVGRLLAEAGNDNPDPLQGLREELSASGAMVAVLHLLVGELDVAQLHHRGRPHALISLLGEWSDRRARQCELALKVGFAERELGLAEDQGALVAKLVNAVLGSEELGLSEGQLGLARRLLAANLRALPGGKGSPPDGLTPA
jgi:hypothetical protein